jgi:hypothetical protein
MKKTVLFAGAAALAFAAPLLAQPGKGHGQGKAQGHGNHATVNHGNSHADDKAHRRSDRGLVTSDRYGRLYALDARGSCPPGLAKRNNGCLPPGQAKKLYNVGQRYNRNFGSAWTYSQVPDYLRSQYNLNQSDRYYYNNGYVYQVDPRSMLVQQVISTLLR